MRTKYAAGNWKMNLTFEEGQILFSEVTNMVKDEVVNPNVKVVMGVPAPYLSSFSKLINTDKVSIAAQNCHPEASGAFTGEMSVGMLASAGVDHIIIGHSERREYFNESDEFIAAKVNAILAGGLTPIFCCGETLEQREAGIHFDFVKGQLTKGLFQLSAEELQKVVIAYEPIWAIGTGVTASSDQAQEMHKALRAHLASKYGADVAANISILYGGSVKPGNAGELFAQPDIDGGLVGGASLDSRGFTDIAKAFPA
ncbi:triose-phosphate isomerase [Arcticibacterium luteifluviistationis]|uniref:Triosephosphate isomerase n=1 Tax=Arcticibacterium luteifluviistationis TaxID=1784714 RepID=A0A2Z4GEQ9_9BACT|nr:triose-phosphate isomerase [Arcticibacterium luteifluviistationis]AWV99515.1 triose-phosphate isomerase [Arcticibacterium luteifluviistationis]